MADNSDGGQLITLAEYDLIHTFPLPVDVTWEMADTLFMRLNNTFYNWDHGKLEGPNMVDYTEFNTLAKQIEADTEVAKQVRADSCHLNKRNIFKRRSRAYSSSLSMSHMHTYTYASTHARTNTLTHSQSTHTIELCDSF